MATVSSQGADLYYEVHGDGPAVVFAHGRGGNAASWWQQVPTFSQRYRVVVFDHRCFGRSRCSPQDFDRARFHQDLMAILDAEGIDEAAIVCQSMGGWTGLKAALQYPQRVSCLVLSNTPAGIDTPQVAAALSRTKEIFASEGVGRAAVSTSFFERAPDRAYLYAQIGGLNIHLPENLYGSDSGITPSELANIATPTLFIASDEDALFPPALIESLSRMIPGASYKQLVGAGHSPYFEIPEVFNRVVGAFLAEHINRTGRKT